MAGEWRSREEYLERAQIGEGIFVSLSSNIHEAALRT